MTGYDITLSNGDLLATINVKTVDDRAHSSLVLIGQGVPNYGADIAQDLVWLLENFAKASPPVHPLIGQNWYDTVNRQLNVYTGSDWQPLLTAESAFGGLFAMLLTATNIDFSVPATIAIFTGPDTTRTYCPTHLVLVPSGSISATAGPSFNLYTQVLGDILASTSLSVTSSNAFVTIPLGPQPQMIKNGATVYLNITTTVSGQINYNAYLFGLIV